MEGVLEPAAAYVRGSTLMQKDGYSPEVQRASIADRAPRDGYYIAIEDEDWESGHKVTRKGYQRILDAVRAKKVKAVYVFMFDRWGRDGVEWLARAQELRRLGVILISVQEGKEEGGLISFVRAGMAQEESHKIARRVIGPRRAAAWAGQYMGETPFGYKRLYPEWDGKGKRPAGRLVPDPATDWIVAELYRRYAAGEGSLRVLAGWMQADPRVPPPPGGAERWNGGEIRNILRKVVYKGCVSYDVHPSGRFERAAEGTAFVRPGMHPAIVDPDLFETVQRRLVDARSHSAYRSQRKDGPPPAVLAGLLRCHVCGGLVIRSHRHERGQYICLRRQRAVDVCASRGYNVDLADEAIIREISRLRGHPWTAQTDRRLTTARRLDDGATVRQALADERARLERHVRRFGDRDDEPTRAERDAHRVVTAEIAVRIEALAARCDEARKTIVPLPDLKTAHELLRHMSIRDTAMDCVATGDGARLRQLIKGWVSSATLVERWPDINSSWLRFEVDWSPVARALMGAGLLTLEDAPGRPEPDSDAAALSREEVARRHRESALRWYHGTKKPRLLADPVAHEAAREAGRQSSRRLYQRRKQQKSRKDTEENETSPL